MATILEVARRAGVSIATVSHVINKTRKVNPETTSKVEIAIRELNYQPNDQARGLKTGHSYQIAVLNYFSVDDYFSEVLSSIEATAYQAGYNVLLRHSEPNGEDQVAALKPWLNKNIDGLIINTPDVTEEVHLILRQLACPCVFLHTEDSSGLCNTILADDLETSKKAVEYLIGLGHRRIACISGFARDYQSPARRLLGYKQALAEAGIPIREEYMGETCYRTQEAYEVARRLLENQERPTAIFTYSDLLALGAIRAAKDLGVSVPGDLSVIGFDDIELASYTTPRLTTVFQDKKKCGELAVEMILRQIQDPELPPEKVVLPTELIVRESTAPARQ